MRRIVLELAEDTSETECGSCLLACCESHCEAFGDLPSEEKRHPDCLAAERALSRLLDVSPEDAASWAYGYWPNEGRKMVRDALVEHAKKAEVKP